jgi:hypothetical protein
LIHAARTRRRGHDMLDLAMLALALVLFWVLDRYAVGLERL